MGLEYQMKRLFVGLSLPVEISSALVLLQFGVRGASWVPPEQFHLTLCFIGKINNRVVEDVFEILEGINQKSFSLQLTGVNHFATKGSMKSLWVGVEKNPDLLALRKKICSTLIRNNISPDTREFYPHVTIAKLRNASLQDISWYERTNNLFKTNRFRVTDFTIFESYLKRTASTYISLNDISLIKK